VTSKPLRQAILDFSAGRVDAANRGCRALLALAPDDPGALHLLGLIAHREGRTAQAAELLRRAAEAPDTTALYLLNYAELVCSGSDRNKALAATRRAVALDENSLLARFCLGNLLLVTKDYAQSRACFERVLAGDAGFWQARANLAILAARQGDGTEAVAQFERLLAQQPDNGELHGNFAALLEELGFGERALAHAELARRSQPDVMLHALRAAEIEMRLGRYAAALARVEAIGERTPDDAARIALQAHLLRELDRPGEAVTMCSAALERGIESAELLRASALALQGDGAEELALTAFDRAARSPGATAASVALALSDKGVLLDQLGRPEAAVAAFDAALREDAALADAWYNRANAKRHVAGDPDLAAMESLLERAGVQRDRLLLHFALGKAHFDAEDLTPAFSHWHEGNRMKRLSIEYDAAATTRRMAAIGADAIEAGSRHDGAAVPSPLRPDDPRSSEIPVFIVGMPRSGSTLVEQILASHPAVHGGGELLQLRPLFESAAGEPLATATAALARLRRAAPQADRIIDKDLLNFLHLGRIHATFPRARIIHCRRDPLETCFSAYTKLFVGAFDFAYRMDELGRYYRAYHALMAQWRQLLPQQVFYEVDYESLVAEPQRETQRLLTFLGLDWSDDCLRFFATSRPVRTSSVAEVRRPIYHTSLSRAAAVRGHLGPLVAALGDLARPAQRATPMP
jgi:tetratricopeptide (TPR) repeat protein